MFVNDDYIVILRPKEKDSRFIKNNWIFKFNGSGGVFRTERDCVNTITSTDIQYFQNTLWRYATSQEITEYKRLGKPFDTGLLNSNNYEIY